MRFRCVLISLCAIVFSACAEGDSPFPYCPNVPTDFNLAAYVKQFGPIEGAVSLFTYEKYDGRLEGGLVFRQVCCFDTAGRCIDLYGRDSQTSWRCHFEYDSLGRRVAEQCYRDSAGTPYESLAAYHTRTTYAYGRDGRRCRARIVGQNGREYTFRFHFDENRNLTKYIFPDGSRFSYEYDDEGRLTKRTNPDASVLRYEDDGAALSVVKDSLGRVVESVTEEATGVTVSYYRYDVRSNWTRRTTVAGSGATTIEIRTFEYYE